MQEVSALIDRLTKYKEHILHVYDKLVIDPNDPVFLHDTPVEIMANFLEMWIGLKLNNFTDESKLKRVYREDRSEFKNFVEKRIVPKWKSPAKLKAKSENTISIKFTVKTNNKKRKLDEDMGIKRTLGDQFQKVIKSIKLATKSIEKEISPKLTINTMCFHMDVQYPRIYNVVFRITYKPIFPLCTALYKRNGVIYKISCMDHFDRNIFRLIDRLSKIPILFFKNYKY